ncbi:AraC family transcriptional regulator [Bordetella genomosp. 11]|uniref:AraC family transcriptional regulator n=1 Tax=Bordetella genomosp. 11 TaxID=1416808 RepID=A0A261UGS5_9BORD|nr:helix-turn-helix transcriptional regulator [Bordetella genomosp. 11]OZI61139.1 AraC family transcriptional regulator [Bordetella genomosp. 11]
MLLEALFKDFNLDGATGPVIGIRLETTDYGSEIPVHRHRQGQLILALKGGVTCEVAGAIWMVPPQYAVWVPGMMPHRVRATANARICYLYVQPGAGCLPSDCCTLAISPLVQALILDMAGQPADYAADSPTGRKAVVLLEELATMPVEHLHVPTSDEPRMRRIATMLSDRPADRRTLADWARLVAMSERSLARLVRQETGMTFGRWRQQLHLIIALRQLAAGQTVQRVAEQLGYESVTAFITMFKKAVGKPPAKYFASIG